MKNIARSGIISLLIITLFGCNNDDDTIVGNENGIIIGSWKLVEASISSGGPQYLVEIEDGEEFEFLNNGNFTTTRDTECTEGKFTIESNELSLIYDCDGFNPHVENPDGAITYQITFGSDYFILVPTTVMCVEGCSYKYKKVTAEK